MKEYPSMTVYSASAGAGKTFTLAVRYIELLIENPLAYRETLAVTFTNKATEEMKMRIMSQLYGLAHGLKNSDSYLNRIIEDMEVDAKTVRERAAKALQFILHDYSHFAVETIDAFFQRVLRNLARELELNPNLRVELNDTDVEELAVDELVTDLKRGNEVLDWIMEYVAQQMDEDKDWNVIKNIKQFGRKIFSEQYKENSKQLNEVLGNVAFFKEFRKNMRDLADVSTLETRMKERAEEFFKMIESKGYSYVDFVGKSNSACSYFKKLQDGNCLDTPRKIVTKTIQKAIDGPEGWTNGSPDTPLYIYARAELVPFIRKTEEERLSMQRTIITAREVLHHLNDLRLLNKIEQKVREMNQEQSRFLLSDTQSFLAELMRDDDAPFVYEKIGGRLQNIMIDEFQDTSTIQWHNFKKLLLNTLADGNAKSLIVGDVKQSIYRWRNGDWSLLHNMDNDKDIQRHSYERIPLRDNWRSEERIIKFNNEFFEKAALVFKAILEEDGNKEAQLIADIFCKDFLEQTVPEMKQKRKDYATRGLIDITLLNSQERHNSDEHLKRTADIIRDLIAKNADDKDIAILLRDKKHISQLADYLQHEIPDHRFISDEAYRLDASVAVGIIINAIRLLLHPDDEVCRAQLVRDYQEKVLRNKLDLSLLRDEEYLLKLLPDGFLNRRATLVAKPVMDLIDEISTLFQLDLLTDEAAYIYSFIDQVSTFAQKNIPDLNLLLEVWEESMHKKTVKNGDLKGISLITIHKSKGLEFNHVIMPFCNWDMVVNGGETLWCQTDVAPFADIPVIPVKSSRLKGTVYDSYYHTERLQNCIDNLNLLYVAFTRAAQNLYVIGQNMTTQTGLGTSTISCFIQRTLPLLAGYLQGSTIIGDTKKGDEVSFTYGSQYINNSEESTTDNVLLRKGTDQPVSMQQTNARIEFRQSNDSRAFVSADADAENSAYIEAGTIMHDVLSQINTHKDIERVLRDFEQAGIISSEADDENKPNRAKMAEFLRKRLTENPNKEVNRWFSDGIEVMNECTIVTRDPRSKIVIERRPDRVVMEQDCVTVVDFKFGSPKSIHTDQVRNYVSMLKEMGCRNVKGCLWYVYQNEVVPV